MSDPQADLEGIADLALTEIKNRFENKADDIPDHVLAKYFTDVNKVIDRRSEKEHEEESKPFSLMDELSTLPRERARALVKEEIGRLRSELVHYEEWLQDAQDQGIPPASQAQEEA